MQFCAISRPAPTKHKKEQGAKTSKRRKYELVEEGWGQRAEVKSLNKLKEPPTTPSSPLQVPQPLTPSSLTQYSSPTAPQISPISPRYPDHSSLTKESNEQGLPPVQVAPSVEHLHAGHLGEVTKGWDSDLTIPPPPLPPASSNTQGAAAQEEQEGKSPE